MRARADNPIAIHHQAGRYTTIAPLSLIIFFFCSPSFFRVRVPKPRASRLFTVLASSCTTVNGFRWANRLLSSIKCHRRGQTLSAKSRRFVWCSSGRDLSPTRIRYSRDIKKKSLRKKFFDGEDST